MERFTYIYDTYCGWCRGSHPIVEALIESGANVRVLHRHLFVGDNAHSMKGGFGQYALTHDKRISKLSGLSFSEKYISGILESPTEAIDSTYTAWAAALISDQGSKVEMAVAGKLLNLRYQEGISAFDKGVVERVLKEFGENRPLEEGKDRAKRISEEAIHLLQEQQRTSVPTLIHHSPTQNKLIDIISYFGQPNRITALA